MKLAAALALVTATAAAGPTALVQPDRAPMAIPGEPGVVIEHHAAPGHCSSTKLVARRTSVRVADAQLAAVLLDAMPSPDITNAARTRFHTWFSRNQSRAEFFGSNDVRDIARAIIAFRYIGRSTFPRYEFPYDPHGNRACGFPAHGLRESSRPNGTG